MSQPLPPPAALTSVSQVGRAQKTMGKSLLTEDFGAKGIVLKVFPGGKPRATDPSHILFCFYILWSLRWEVAVPQSPGGGECRFVIAALPGMSKNRPSALLQPLRLSPPMGRSTWGPHERGLRSIRQFWHGHTDPCCTARRRALQSDATISKSAACV